MRGDFQTVLPPTASHRAPKLADRLVRPFIRFMELEVSSALLLLSMALLALVWANSPWGDSYTAVWEATPLGIHLGAHFAIEMTLGEWVNDGLMVIFFFAVGMEIKREMVHGELSTRDKAMLPLFGALGGMVVPASIYLMFHLGGPAERGWGIPMATDIAFAVAALSVFGRRVPPGLRIFLLALAIVDDLGAVAVIALVYTAELHLDALAWAGAGLLLCALLNWIGVRAILVYAVIGLFVWYETHHSGVHATIAGVALGLLTPTAIERDDEETLYQRARGGLERLRELLTGEEREDVLDHSGHERHRVFRLLSGVGRQTLSPLDYLLILLERPVAFIIMPVFALANAGVVLSADTLLAAESQSVAVAVALGLLIGKPLGITIFCWLSVKWLRIAVLPKRVDWWMLNATGVLAGIGFTVALFVTGLAFESPIFVAGSKIGILIGSVVATLLGMQVLRRVLPAATPGS